VIATSGNDGQKSASRVKDEVEEEASDSEVEVTEDTAAAATPAAETEVKTESE
jgi:hypothetical protein